MPLIDFNKPKPTTECEIDGKRIPYDACATGELESAKGISYAFRLHRFRHENMDKRN